MNDEYLQYSVEDFLIDDSFIEYSKNTSKTHTDMWKNWLSEHPEKAAVCRQAMNIINSIQFKEDQIKLEKVNHIWDNINENIINTKDSKVISIQRGKRQQWIKIITGVAASILLFYFVAGVWTNKDHLKITSYAETDNLVLPDNSTIDLNVDSKVAYNTKSWNIERKIELAGEAFFKVQKGKKFSVHTAQAIIEVLGTSFNVYDRENRLNVRCETGKVRVISAIIKDTIVLFPGYGVDMKEDKIMKKYSFKLQEKDIWKDGFLTFKEEPLDYVFSTLERQYDVTIEIDKSLAKNTYTGKIKQVNLKESLYSICWPMHLDYSITGDYIVITKQ